MKNRTERGCGCGHKRAEGGRGGDRHGLCGAFVCVRHASEDVLVDRRAGTSALAPGVDEDEDVVGANGEDDVDREEREDVHRCDPEYEAVQAECQGERHHNVEHTRRGDERRTGMEPHVAEDE